MKKALVIPIQSTYTGGELLCLHVCRALLRAGYEVTLFSDTNDPAKAEQVYPGMGQVLAGCSHISSSTSHKAIPGRTTNVYQGPSEIGSGSRRASDGEESQMLSVV